MNNTPSLEDAAKEICRIAVRDLHLQAGAQIAAPPVIARFNNLPWKPADLRPALVHAQQLGWVTEDGRLTSAGFAAAPL
jgi:hypothetical protein